MTMVTGTILVPSTLYTPLLQAPDFVDFADSWNVEENCPPCGDCPHGSHEELCPGHPDAIVEEAIKQCDIFTDENGNNIQPNLNR